MRQAMGAYGRERVETALEWRYEVPKLLAAYEMLFTSQGTQPVAVSPQPVDRLVE
jgi:hypothetical protein